jgi:hypothetical protein
MTIFRNAKTSIAVVAWIALLIYSGCSEKNDPEPVDCNLSDLALTFTSANQTGCGTADGSIAANATGGSPPYQFAIGSQTFGSSPNFTNLSAGTYELKVKDKNECERTGSVTLIQPGSTLAFTVSTAESGCKTSSGSITINATGGLEPYTYKLNDGAASTSSVFNNLAAGTYSVKVTDNANCSFTQSVKVITEIKFSTVIKNIIDTKCAVSTCHVTGGSAPFVLTTYETIKAHAAGIKSSTQSGQMPKNGPKLPQSELDAIACWVDDGALNN